MDRELESSDTENIEVEYLEEQTDDENCEQDMDNIMQAVLPEEIEMVKSKLKTTKKYRQARIMKLDVDISNEYGCFFVCPELVKQIYNFV